MRIPSRFKLYGQTIEVIFKDDIGHIENARGFAVYAKNEIHIQTSVPGYTRTKEQIEDTFFHELVHWLLYCEGTQDASGCLRTNEEFVSRIGGLLHQAFSTMEYEDTELIVHNTGTHQALTTDSK